MANTVMRNNNRRSGYSRQRMYVDGNTVRRAQALPKQQPYREPAARPARKPVSRNVQRNRERAQVMSRGFVLFLTLICAAILVTGVRFLQLKSEVTARTRTITSLESELNTLKADNDAYYSQVAASVDLDAIKKKAITELGMKFPSDEQVRYYETERGSYVRQYQDVPDAK